MKNTLCAGLAIISLAACGNADVSEVEVTLPNDYYTSREAAVTEILDAYYAAAADADFDAWIALFTDKARFYGTDATEDWPISEVAEGVEESFTAGKGWDFEVLDRRVTIARDGETAWFAELAHFANTDYTLRPTGVMVNEGGEWRIAQLVMGVPFPNDIYDPMRMALQAAETGAEVETEAVNQVLDRLHGHAANGALDAYFALFTEDAIFLGTDQAERWDMDEFRAYAAPAFEDGEGWTYTPVRREVVLGPMMNVAWFDEVLTHERYSNTRGSGVLIRTDDGWKISQYNLTFLVPNDVASAVNEIVQDAE